MIYRSKTLNNGDKRFSYGFLDKSIDFSPGNEFARETFFSLINDNSSVIREVGQVHGKSIAVLGGGRVLERHGHKFVETNPANNGTGFIGNYDGMFTSEPGNILCIRTADCIPVLLFNKGMNVIGALHCGWRGIFEGIIGNAAYFLENYFKSNLSEVISILGPAICSECFEIQNDFINLFISMDSNSMDFVIKKNGKSFFRLKDFLTYQLEKYGFDPVNIYDLDICSMEHPDFNSYRRDNTGKRQVSYITLH